MAETSPIAVVLAVETIYVRERLALELTEAGIGCNTLGARYDAAGIELTPAQVLIVETGEDAAKLVQVVDTLYQQRDPLSQRPAIVGIVSREALQRNPALGFWLIDGQAALLCLWISEEIEYNNVPAFLRRLYSGTNGPVDSP